jgi:branched-subunit amino acid transport protein
MKMTNEAWLILGMMVVTFGARYPVLAILSQTPLPKGIFRALNYVPPAVLTAIIVPAILLPDGEISFSLNNAPLFAGIISMIIAWRSKNLLLTIVLGMGAFWGWRWLIPLL